MVELGTRCTTERVHVGHSPPTVARACALLDQPVTLAMAAGLPDHVWTMDELRSFRVPPKHLWC